MFLPDINIALGDGETIALRRRSIAEYREALRVRNNEFGRSRNGDYSSCHTGKTWYGTASADEYLKMLDEGYKGATKGVKGLDGLASDMAEKLSFVSNVAGAFPIVPAYLAGAPDNMRCPVNQRDESRRGVTLVIDGCFSANVASAEVLAYAQEVMCMLAWLTAERIETAVYMIVPIHLTGKTVTYVTCIRSAGSVLAPERIAAYLHPSFLRRLWFSMVETEYHLDEGKTFPECRACKTSYGGVRSATADEIRAAIPEAYSVIMLPKIGRTSPTAAVEQALNIKLRKED